MTRNIIPVPGMVATFWFDKQQSKPEYRAVIQQVLDDNGTLAYCRLKGGLGFESSRWVSDDNLGHDDVRVPFFRKWVWWLEYRTGLGRAVRAGGNLWKVLAILYIAWWLTK